VTELHPPGRRRLRSAARSDGYEMWTIEQAQYDALRELILRAVADLDEGRGVQVGALIAVAEAELTGHPRFPSGRFTNWVRFVKVDLECEGVLERIGRGSPQRVRLVDRT
jgi:hypothetical protein